MSGGKGASPHAESKATCTATIRNSRGLHARAAGLFVKTAGAYNADITVRKGDQTVSGLSIMGLMMLAAGPGTEIELAATGADAADAVQALCEMIESDFEED